MRPSAPAPTAPAATFLRAAARSRLLDPNRLERLTAMTSEADPNPMAEQLVESGELTRFQAEKLLHGYWQGLVVGPYRVLFPIGRGGVGVVYLARDDRQGTMYRLIALKVLPPKKARDHPRMLARFLREKALGPDLPPHPHLARTIEAGEADGVHYLAMEYVPGPTMRHLAQTGGPLAVGSACRAFADAAAGLSAAHAVGFVHRDFKPANLIVTPLGRGKVLDFGFAIRAGEPTPADPAVIGGPGYTLGTMDYIAPEQTANAATVGPPADVYAFGCSLYFALAGCPPFPGGGTQEKIRWHRTVEPPPVSQINPSVPTELDALIRVCMAKNPNARPAAADLAKRLAAWADPVRVSPPGGGPSESELIRLAEGRWQSSRVSAIGGEDDDCSDSDSGNEVGPQTNGFRLPFARAELALAALALATLFFLLGLAVARF